MIIDRLNTFANALALSTAAPATAQFGDIIDLNAAGDAYGKELYLIIQVSTAVTSAGSATVQFKLETDNDEAFGSATELWAGSAIGKATLVAGYQVVAIRIPAGCERYLRVTQTIGTAALTAGAAHAFLAEAPQANDFTS